MKYRQYIDNLNVGSTCFSLNDVGCKFLDSLQQEIHNCLDGQPLPIYDQDIYENYTKECGGDDLMARVQSWGPAGNDQWSDEYVVLQDMNYGYTIATSVALIHAVLNTASNC